jgi:cytoskeletal protein RodZ
MGQFGEDLRRERESRGIALETITDSTKISGRHLSALEREQFEQLPGGVFNKGIVRGYARVVGLDEEAWVERYISAYQQSGQLKEDDAEWIHFAENVVKARKTDAERPDLRLRWAGVFLLLILIAGLGWFVYHYVREKVAAHGSPTQEAPIRASSRLSTPRLPASGVQNSIVPSRS